MSLSYTTLATLNKRDAIVLVRGSKAAAAIYAYLRMTRDRLKACDQAMTQGKTINLGDYGEIIAYGNGEPDEETRQMMEEEYSFQHSGDDAVA